MKTATQGFTLIEWLIYFFLIMVVLTGMFHFTTTVHQRIIGLGRQVSLFSQLCAAQDALFRDLSMAPQQVEQWDAVGPELIVWRQDDALYSWNVESGMLVRRKKRFDAVQKVWKSTRKSVVARGTIAFNVTPLYNRNDDHRLQGMDVYLGAGKAIGVRMTVMLRNGTLR